MRKIINEEFREFLERASKIVKSWPWWKQNTLEAQTKQFNDKARDPQDG